MNTDSANKALITRHSVCVCVRENIETGRERHGYVQRLRWAMKGTTGLNGINETMRERGLGLVVSAGVRFLLSSPTTGVAQFLVSLFQDQSIMKQERMNKRPVQVTHKRTLGTRDKL